MEKILLQERFEYIKKRIVVLKQLTQLLPTFASLRDSTDGRLRLDS